MNKLLIAAAAASLIAMTGASFAKTEAGAGLFDQGGDYYNRSVAASNNDSGLDRRSTASFSNDAVRDMSAGAKAQQPGIPSDFRNEPGLGMFDRVNH